ncbi:MAG: DUF4384 domain-containing protein [Calditerrivibrio sp.]|nr:DUF4384 domain-containing protein [Calditerrivibrio sp.]
MLKYLVLILLTTSLSFASVSFITESKGISCMTSTSKPEETEYKAILDAKNDAINNILKLRPELINFFNFENSRFELISKSSKWDIEPAQINSCIKVNTKIAIFPTPKDNIKDDTLNVTIIPNRDKYFLGNEIKFYIKSSKPFYSRIFYRDKENKLYLIFPNKYSLNNLFESGVIHEVPSSADKFKLSYDKNTPKEQFIFFISPSPLNTPNLTDSTIPIINIDPKELFSKIADIQINSKEKIYVEELYYKNIELK